MDLKRWIYSPDIARWLSVGREMELMEWVDCILSAPHRTLEEKLEGLRELRREAGGEADIRRDYVRELEERCRNGEAKRLAEELALSRTHQVIGGEDG